MKNRKSRLTGLIAVLAVLSLFVAACGSSSKTSTKKTTTTGVGATPTSAADKGALAKLSGKLDGGGSSFQDTFEQKATSDFGAAVKAAGGSTTITYTKSGSSDGKKGLGDKTLDFAGSDSPIKPEEKSSFGTRKILYFPIVAGPIAVAYKLKGVTDLKLSADTIAKIFQAQITTWDDPAIKADNPGATLPSTKISVVHRSDGSGTTSNFTKFLVAASPKVWKLDKGETVKWPGSTQGGEKSTGVTAIIKGTDGAVGYVDLSDAAKENLDVAAVKGSGSDFVKPTSDSASKALAATTVAADLTYNPIDAKGAGAYPITSPTWILVDAKQSSAAKADVLKAYLKFILDQEQTQATSLLYAPLPDALKQKAVAQIEQITAG
ncbi:MAG: phosphate ABC transporter substrate-binding protein PstS [Actinomycetota bacterium]|nr:phosphate ABC transporter substrate-binding protein PstS [Actinomycetota bacterium]